MSKINDEENREEKREHSKFSNKSQLRSLLEDINEHYHRDTIEQVLKYMPSAPEKTETIGRDEKELTGIFRAYIDAFGLELFWKELHEIGYRPKKTYSASAGDIVDLNSISSIRIIGKYQGSIISHTKEDFSKQEWEIEMLEDGSIILHYKGGQKWSDDFYSIEVSKGDIISASGSCLHINHISTNIINSTPFSPTMFTNVQSRYSSP